MGFVAGMLMAVVAVAVLVVTVVSVPTTGSVMLSSFSWSDCGNSSDPALLLNVSKLDVTSPLSIPGQVAINELEATLTGPLPADALITFDLFSNSSFGPEYPRQLPCFQNQGGSCAYKVCDMVTLGQQSSSVTRQLVTALTRGGLNAQCPVSASSTISLRDVTIHIPSMLHTPMDTVINTNNYFLTAKLMSADGANTLGCLQLNMPVYKSCEGLWLCPQSIDHVIQVMNG